MSLIFATRGRKILSSVAGIPVLCEALSEPGALDCSLAIGLDVGVGFGWGQPTC